MSKSLIDTNLIIRFLVNDDSSKASKVEKLLGRKSSDYVLLDIVVAEIIWVLSSYYQQTKLSVIEKIRALIHLESISCNKTLLNHSLLIWGSNNISFIDSYLAAKAEIENLPVYSYDC